MRLWFEFIWLWMCSVACCELTVIKFWALQKVGIFFTTWETVNFSRTNILYDFVT